MSQAQASTDAPIIMVTMSLDYGRLARESKPRTVYVILLLSGRRLGLGLGDRLGVLREIQGSSRRGAPGRRKA